MAEEKKKSDKKKVQLLYLINSLNQKIYQAESQASVAFITLNDTINLVRYDRALLWNFEKRQPELIGISGQSKYDKKSELARNWTKLMQLISDPTQPQILQRWNFAHEDKLWHELQGKSNTTVLWLPVMQENKLILGLWLELWHYRPEPPPSQEESLNLLNSFLIPVIAASWTKLQPKYSTSRLFQITKKQGVLGAAALLFLLFAVQVPLRIVAPCEVVPDDPYVIAAPLDGIIEEVVVDPGQQVKEGETLFEYDKNVPLQELNIAKKQVDIARSELNRTLKQGLEDPESRAEVAILRLRLEKDLLALNLAEYEVSQLTVVSPEEGIVVLDNPDQWRGRSVQVGEAIMQVTNPDRTKVKIWISESDNIAIDPEKPVKIILNVRPGQAEEAKLIYIANVSTINDQNIPSFIAEAEWVDPEIDVKMGLKGTAILYGRRVSLFYFLFRKPWYALRYYLGV